MSHHFNPAYQQLVSLNQYQPQYGRFGNCMPYGQRYDHNVSIRRNQHTNSRPHQNSRKSNPKAFRQQQPQAPNAYSDIVKSSKAFCETEECSPAAKQIIALLTSLLEATSNNQQSHSTESIDEHRRQHSIVIANLPESVSGSAQTRVSEDGRLKMMIRLKRLDLQSLESRRLISDLIMVYKIIHHKVPLDPKSFFNFPARPSPRRHEFQIKPKYIDTKKQNSFSTRIINFWNDLDQEKLMLKRYQFIKENLSET